MTFSISTRYSLLFGRMLRALFCAAAVLMAQTAHAEEPRLLWSYEAESNLYAPPLVADVHEASGLESIISDSEARVVRCISATGELLWTFDGGWSRRLTSRAALSYSAREGQGTLAICGSDGKLACLDAASGTRLWDASPGGITWGAVLWTDLDGDQRDELIAPTESNGIHAFNADGSERWVYRGEDEQHAVLVRGAMAAADVNGDGRPELFAANRWGVLQLNADGTRGWEQFTGDDFNSSVTVADIDMDGRAEVFACS
ncbi:MAG: PQQ-binding-like beta-propeller repeat protein, partial [Candidatus Hydrogenedentes bacterium]|nr:PQQ-binding-like beta-propeller repeat protein [Candidatus Hydrogenedentota bacterium]